MPFDIINCLLSILSLINGKIIIDIIDNKDNKDAMENICFENNIKFDNNYGLILKQIKLRIGEYNNKLKLLVSNIKLLKDIKICNKLHHSLNVYYDPKSFYKIFNLC